MMEVTNVDKYYSLLGIRPSMISDSIFGNVYVLANLDKSNYPKVFIGYSTKKEQFYLFNCIYREDAIYPFGKLVEYIVVDLTSEDLFKIKNKGMKMEELYNNKTIFSYVIDDTDGDLEQVQISYLSKEEDISNVDFYDTLEMELKLTSEQFNEIILLYTL